MKKSDCVESDETSPLNILEIKVRTGVNPFKKICSKLVDDSLFELIKEDEQLGDSTEDV
jgi:hypothetical protein